MSQFDGPFPNRVETGNIAFVALTPALVEQDYAAVMRNVSMLRAWSGQDWPTTDFTIEENLVDLERHHREQQEGIALTYSVLVGAEVQGCIYVRPFEDALRSRDLEPPSPPHAPRTDAVARGWAHEPSAEELIVATRALLTGPPFRFTDVSWMTNTDCADQLDACDRLGLTASVDIADGVRTWVLRALPVVGPLSVVTA